MYYPIYIVYIDEGTSYAKLWIGHFAIGKQEMTPHQCHYLKVPLPQTQKT